MGRTTRLFAVVLPLGLAGLAPAWAAVSPEQAQQLKTTLTPFGAERAGNADGTIPAWTGGDTNVAGLSADKNVPDRFPNEKKLFTINAGNVEQYASKLPAGAVDLIKRFPGYRIDVYPTHRTGGAAPQWVYDNTFQNATRASLPAPNDVEGAFGGVPFPIPQDGREIAWNNNLHWEGTNSYDKYSTWVVPRGGRPSLSGTAAVEYYHVYYDPQLNINNFGNLQFMIRIHYSAPASRNGEAILSVNPSNFSKATLAVWQYLTGQRRLRMAPNLAYDGVYPDCGGYMTTDENRVFFDQADRYNMKIVGKKEMYIPYNVNNLVNVPMTEVLTPDYVNPDHIRWELHRVWDVDFTLVAGARHIVPHRHVYFDEDTWQAVASDEYDNQGRLWKFNVALMYDQPLIPSVWNSAAIIYDLVGGGYCLNGYGMNRGNIALAPAPYKPHSYFEPATVAADALE